VSSHICICVESYQAAYPASVIPLNDNSPLLGGIKLETKDVVESYSRIFGGFREIAEETRASARSRLVWFVAIAGFAILNGKKIWDPIADGEFTGIALALLALPWAISALLAVITHFIIDEAGVKDDHYYVMKLAAIDLHLESVKHGDADHMEMIKIINDTHPDLAEPKKMSEKWGNAAKWLERTTFFILVAGFLWALIGPFVLSYCAY